MVRRGSTVRVRQRAFLVFQGFLTSPLPSLTPSCERGANELRAREGRIRHHHFGEGGYEECERVIQELLGTEGRDLVAPTPEGFEVQADWANLASPETYLGSDQVQNFAGLDVPLDSLRLNDWTLAGDWTIERGASVLNDAGGRIAFRFHARDVNLVLGRQTRRTSVPFRVLVDGEMPGDARGLDVDEEGNGTVVHQRLYQLVREPGAITDRTFQITFLDPASRRTCSRSASRAIE
jgi:hypothetical protein